MSFFYNNLFYTWSFSILIICKSQSWKLIRSPHFILHVVIPISDLKQETIEHLFGWVVELFHKVYINVIIQHNI